MRPFSPFVPVLLLAFLALPGCARKPPSEAAPSLTAEAAVKPEPEKEPATAAPPAMPELGLPEAVPPVRPAAPEEQTKATLEPKAIPAASLPQPKSQPAAKHSPAEPARPATDTTAPSQGTPERSASGQAKDAQASIAVVGDSLAVGIGMTMTERLARSQGLGCHPLGKVSTGLISKKFFDWEKRLSELVATEKLAAVVVMLGGNDATNSIAGKAAGTPEWDAAYRQKAERFLRIAEAAHVRVLWVGLPAMRDPAYNRQVMAVNAAAKAACATVPGCVYMEASDLFTDGSGNYVQAKDIGGKTVSLRGKDGVHLTMTGYDLLCRQVLDKLAADGALK